MPTEVGDGLVLDLKSLPVLSGPFLVAREKAKHPLISPEGMRQGKENVCWQDLDWLPLSSFLGVWADVPRASDMLRS